MQVRFLENTLQKRKETFCGVEKQSELQQCLRWLLQGLCDSIAVAEVEVRECACRIASHVCQLTVSLMLSVL